MTDDDAHGAPADDAQQVKDRFKEALERKKSANGGKTVGASGGGQKIHGTHGPESHQKSFRRKSG